MVGYLDALNDALERLQDLGYEMEAFPGSGVSAFSMHGPMAAEALASLGHGDQLGRWVESYKSRHRHFVPPPAKNVIDGSDEKSMREALGDFQRVTDWKLFFLQQIKTNSWQTTVAKWCPILISGTMGALTHGLIRTMHAVRGLSVTEQPSELQLDELARGLAYWAARYTEVPEENNHLHRQAVSSISDAAQVPREITNLIKEHAQIFIEEKRAIVPLVHTMTPLNAVRILLPYIPAEEHIAIFENAKATTQKIASRFGSTSSKVTAKVRSAKPQLRPMDELARDAAAHGDEHVIKLTAALQIEHGIAPHDVMLKAVEHVITHVPRPSSREIRTRWAS